MYIYIYISPCVCILIEGSWRVLAGNHLFLATLPCTSLSKNDL